MTTAERDFRNHYMMFGTDAVITKMASKNWVVWTHPGNFKTRKAARVAATNLFLSIGRED